MNRWRDRKIDSRQVDGQTDGKREIKERWMDGLKGNEEWTIVRENVKT